MAVLPRPPRPPVADAILGSERRASTKDWVNGDLLKPSPTPKVQPVAPSADAKWLDPTQLLGRSGDTVLKLILPFVPENYRLMVTYLFRVVWLLLEVLILLQCDRLRDCLTSQCAACLGYVLVTMRVLVLHVLPVVVAYCAAGDEAGSGQWANACRVALYGDSLVYTLALMPMLCNKRARVLLLRTERLTALRLLKLVFTPLETLLVIYGTFGQGFAYQRRRRRRSRDAQPDGSDLKAEASLHAGAEEPLQEDAPESIEEAEGEQEVAREHEVSMPLVWVLWILFVVLGVVFSGHWYYTDEPPCTSRIVATAIFAMYGAGSAITALVYACDADALAARAYGLAPVQWHEECSRGASVGVGTSASAAGPHSAAATAALAAAPPSWPAWAEELERVDSFEPAVPSFGSKTGLAVLTSRRDQGPAYSPVGTGETGMTVSLAFAAAESQDLVTQPGSRSSLLWSATSLAVYPSGLSSSVWSAGTLPAPYPGAAVLGTYDRAASEADSLATSLDSGPYAGELGSAPGTTASEPRWSDPATWMFLVRPGSGQSEFTGH